MSERTSGASDGATSPATAAGAGAGAGAGAATTPAVGVRDFCDCHFHWWDTDAAPNPNLGGIASKFARYLPCHYKADTAETVFVEGLAASDADAPAKVVLVPYVHLARPDTATVLASHLGASKRVRGVRMILNHHDTDATLVWPQVERGDFWAQPRFVEGFALLAKHNLSFDCQVNPHQLQDAAAFFAGHPTVPVILNHIGCLKLDPADSSTHQAQIDVWEAGMQALAKLSHVHVKLSAPCYTLTGWESSPDARAILIRLFRQIIEWFGSRRCMFATNFPVDKFMGADAPTLLALFDDIVSDLTPAEQDDCFRATAMRVYRIDESAGGADS